jgi:alpha-beta hydrolase superfamily lysophospholipase
MCYIEHMQSEKKTQKPYLVTQRITRYFAYNPNYGDDRICTCGHPYYRHFDTYDDMSAVGCKYCDCVMFSEQKKG